MERIEMACGKYQVINITDDTEDPKFDKPEGECVIYRTEDREKARLFYEGCHDGVLQGKMTFALIAPDGRLLAAG